MKNKNGFKIIEDECENIISKIDFSSLENKKVLITGSSGLLGVYISCCLLKLNKNMQIFCWVNSKIDSIFNDLFNNDKINIISGDITSESFLDSVIEQHSSESKFDVIIHSAGYAQPTKFLTDKLKTIKINTASTIKLLSMLKEDGKFVFLSSSEVYSGNEKEQILEEECGLTNPQHPRAAYIESKSCGEAICHAYKELNPQLDIKILRLSLTYGPGTKNNDLRVVSMLIEKGLKNNEIKLLDDGSAIRTYGYISDIIEMFWNIILFGDQTTYNLSGITKCSILEIAKIIGNQLKKPVLLAEAVGLAGNPKSVNLSLDKYMKKFNKTDFISLEHGIANTIEWHKFLYNQELDKW